MQIKLTRYRNIKLQRREAGEVLTVGEDITEGQADTLIRIGGAKKFIPKKKAPAKESKVANPAKENK